VLPKKRRRSEVSASSKWQPDAVGGRGTYRDRFFLGLGHPSHSTSEHAAFDAVRDFLLTTGRNIMNRRTTIMLTGMTLLGLAIAALPQVGFAQSSPLIGTWKLNLDKSKFTGPPSRSLTDTYTQDGQNIRGTARLIDAQGDTATIEFMHIYDGQPHPTTGAAVFDASAYTRVDANTFIFARLKAGNLVLIGTSVVSQDGKTHTVTATGTLPIGLPGTSVILVYDKQ
jgi:hypothetical protein